MLCLQMHFATGSRGSSHPVAGASDAADPGLVAAASAPWLRAAGGMAWASAGVQFHHQIHFNIHGGPRAALDAQAQQKHAAGQNPPRNSFQFPPPNSHTYSPRLHTQNPPRYPPQYSSHIQSGIHRIHHSTRPCNNHAHDCRPVSRHVHSTSLKKQPEHSHSPCAAAPWLTSSSCPLSRAAPPPSPPLSRPRTSRCVCLPFLCPRTSELPGVIPLLLSFFTRHVASVVVLS